MTIELTEKQLDLIKNAVEYLGRHLLGQKGFKCIMQEDWIDKDRVKEYKDILLDMRKSIEHYNDKEYRLKNKDYDCYSVHQGDVIPMGKEPLISINKGINN